MNAGLSRYLEANERRHLAELSEMLRQPSVANRRWGTDEMAALVARRLERLGAKVQTFPTGGDAPPILYAEVGDGERSLLLYNHYDVAPVDPPEAWDSPPFEPEIRDGLLFARSVSDNKGALMARIHAIEAWQEVHGALPLRIRWIIEGEEEVGSPHLAGWAREHRDLLEGNDGCLWEFGYKDMAGRQEINLGSKGLLYVELHARGAADDVHSSFAAIVPSPVWRLTRALATLRDESGAILLDGLAEHVDPPPPAAIPFLERLPFEEEKLKRAWGIPAYLGGLSGPVLVERLLYQPTCNIAGLHAGYTDAGSKTVLPNHAFAKLDFRLVPGLTPELVHDLLRAHLDRRGFEDIEIVTLSRGYVAQSDPADPFVALVIDAVRATSGTEPVVRPISAGSSPMYAVRDVVDVPIVAIGVGHATSNRHAPNENIRVADFFEAIRAMVEIMARMGE